MVDKYVLHIVYILLRNMYFDPHPHKCVLFL